MGAATGAAGRHLCRWILRFGACGSDEVCSPSLRRARLIVVIFPDSGSRYLSKFYDNKWMRENGFLELEFGEVTLGDLLLAKPVKTLFTAALGDSRAKRDGDDAPARHLADACGRAGRNAGGDDRGSGPSESHAGCA